MNDKVEEARLYIMSAVFPRCLSSPFTVIQRTRFIGFLTPSFGTKSDMGQNVSKPLEVVHGNDLALTSC